VKFPYAWLTNEETDLARLKACFDDNDSPRSLEQLRWQYASGLHSSPPLAVLGTTDPNDPRARLSGVYATLQNEFICSGRRVIGTQSLDTLTSKEFRGKGMFGEFAKAVYERAAAREVGFVYGFPNGNSAPGFFGKLGWARLDPVPFLIRPLNAGYVLSKLPGVRKIAQYLPAIRLPARPLGVGSEQRLAHDAAIDERYDSLWEAFASQVGVALNRTGAYLGWRLRDKPGEQYSNIAVFAHSGQMLAICFYAAKDKHGGKVGYVMDLIHRPGREREARVALSHAVAELGRSRCDAVLAWCFEHSPNYAAFRKSGFFKLPERLRPIELHFGARALSPNCKAAAEQRSAWYISYLDSDTV
jgi:hypothetical protein